MEKLDNNISAQDDDNKEVSEDDNLVVDDEEADRLQEAFEKPSPEVAKEDAGDVLLRQALENITPELWDFVVSIAMGPDVPQNASHYEVSNIVNTHISRIQGEANSYIEQILNSLPKEALLALKNKSWVKNKPAQSNYAIPGNGLHRPPAVPMTDKDVAMARIMPIEQAERMFDQ